jgi:D-alanyl-lipoteichoic acid acyltransferase DltB (MBOAT superfamily)
MLKQAFLLIITLLFTLGVLTAQNGDIEYWNEQRLNLQETGMIVLGSWALANFSFSGYKMTQTNESDYYFHQMNVFWNTVNAGIATAGYLSVVNAEPGLSQQDLLLEYNNFSKILLLNTGLDLAYIGAGLYLKERSKNITKHKHRFKGYGNSLILQGGFLFFFDLIMVVKNEQLTQQFLEQTDINISIIPGGFSFLLIF